MISIKKGEQFTIGDDSSLLVSSCGTAKIENIEYKDVIAGIRVSSLGRSVSLASLPIASLFPMSTSL